MKYALLIYATALFLCFSAQAKCQTFTSPDGTTHYLGLKRDPKKLSALKKRSHRMMIEKGQAVTVPGHVDLSSRVSPPEDQGNCGSCWAFGITKALRSAYMLKGKDPGTLAFNYLVNNCGPGPKEWGCGGGDFDAGENFLHGHGPWLESKDPYHESDGGKCLGLPPVATAVKYVTVGPGNRPPTFQELAVALSQQHMLVIDGAVCGRWGNYPSGADSDGVLRKSDCGASMINHIINRVGYDCGTSVDSAGNCVFGADGNTLHHDGYFIDMNNWGDWGKKGYILEAYGVDAFGDTAMYFEIDGPDPVKPIDGGWSDYGPWSACIDGLMKHERTCTNPLPSGGGKPCVGDAVQYAACENKCHGWFMCFLGCWVPFCHH